jgi:carbamate kinase
MKPLIVIALGGNAISSSKKVESLTQQAKNIKKTVELIAPLTKKFNLVLTHGNGPQVGDLLLRSQLCSNRLPELSISIADAMTQGEIGFLIAQELQNILHLKKINKEVVTIVTRVEVSKKDKAFKNPSKPIGEFYSKSEAKKLIKKNKWKMIEEPLKGFRRVVASPKPLKILELNSIKELVLKGKIVVCCGGGGIPVINVNNCFKEVEAVIDKDRTSALLAINLKAQKIVFATSIEKVALNFGKPNQKFLNQLKLRDAKRFLKLGEFPPGSMGPKIESAIKFLENNGKEAIICSLTQISNALKGKNGTKIIK